MSVVNYSKNDELKIEFKSARPELTFDLSGESFNFKTLKKARNLLPIEKLRLNAVLGANYPVDAHYVNNRLGASANYTAYKTLTELTENNLLSQYRRPGTSPGLSPNAEADIFSPKQITRMFKAKNLLEKGKNVSIKISMPNGSTLGYDDFLHVPELNQYEKVALKMLVKARESKSGVSDFALKKELDKLGLRHDNPWNHLNYLRTKYLAYLSGHKFYLTPRGFGLSFILLDNI